MNKSKIDTAFVLSIIFGVVFTALAFVFYFVFKILWLNCLLAVLCLADACITVFYGAKGNEECTEDEKKTLPLALLAIFLIVATIVVSIINPLGYFCMDYFMWAVYASSSIVPIIYTVFMLIALVGSN